MGSLPVWMLLHFVAAAVLTWLARRYALHRQLLDQPGQRRSHSIPTPRGGGISIVVVVLVGCMVLAGQWPEQRLLLSCYAVGLLLVAGIGWVDDHRPLSAGLRLAVQALAAGLLGWAVYVTTLSPWLALVTFVLVMGLVNVWNFMDGIDGLAATQAGLVAAGLALALGLGPAGWLAAGLLAAVCGFLPFNFPRARIFLGDVGSGALGYLLAGLLMVAHITSPVVPWPLLLLPVSAFLVDAGFTLAMRMLKGEKWWTPHTTHLYQGLARKAASHIMVSIGYATFTAASVGLMLAGANSGMNFAILITLLWYLSAVGAWLFLRKELYMDKENQL